jgi:FkbM family methyltransferase
MFGLLIQCIKAFGLRGLIVYVRLKLHLTKKFNVAGVRFPLSMRPTHTDRITFKEIFIKREYDVKLPSSLDVKVIIDAGANIGFTSVFFANRYPQARIFSIEPDPENFEILSLNTAPYKNVSIVKSALWNKKETIHTVDRGFGKRGIMVDKTEGTHSLQAIAIQDLIYEYNFGSIDILKMDIEGSEKEVFSSDYDVWLSKTNCLIIELHDRMKKGCSKAVFEALSKYDFSLSIQGENLVFINNRYL